MRTQGLGTDGRTDGRTDKGIPVYPLLCEWGYNMLTKYDGEPSLYIEMEKLTSAWEPDVNLTKSVDHENEVMVMLYMPDWYVSSMFNVQTKLVSLGCMVIEKLS